MKRLLLITKFAADDLNGGATIVRYWVSRITGAEVFWTSLSKDSGHVSAAEMPQIIRREIYALNARGNTWPGLKQFWRWFDRAVWSQHMAHHLRSRIEALNPDVIWIVFDFGLAPLLARIGRYLT